MIESGRASHGHRSLGLPGHFIVGPSSLRSVCTRSLQRGRVVSPRRRSGRDRLARVGRPVKMEQAHRGRGRSSDRHPYAEEIRGSREAAEAMARASHRCRPLLVVTRIATPCATGAPALSRKLHTRVSGRYSPLPLVQDPQVPPTCARQQGLGSPTRCERGWGAEKAHLSIACLVRVRSRHRVRREKDSSFGRRRFSPSTPRAKRRALWARARTKKEEAARDRVVPLRYPR